MLSKFRILLFFILVVFYYSNVNAAYPWVLYCNAPDIRTTVPFAANYGCWDGTYFWIGGNNQYLYKIDRNGTLIASYNGDSLHEDFDNLIQMAYDGRYLWLASYDDIGKLTKFDPLTGHSVKHYNIGDDWHSGNGGIQGVVYDPSGFLSGFLWLAVPLNGLGFPPHYGGKVEKFNITTEAIDLTITGQTNVNGISLATYGRNTYILAACTLFWTRIDALTGSHIQIADADQSYRITNDGVYAYTTSYDTHVVQKFKLVDGSIVSTWDSGGLLRNSIMYDGYYLWTSGDDNVVTIQNTVGTTLCTMTNTAQSDVIFDGAYVWGVKLNGGSDAQVIRLLDKKLALPTATPTFTVTATPTATATSTPIGVYYYTDKNTTSGSFTMSSSTGWQDIDVSSLLPWASNGFTIKLNYSFLPANASIVAIPHSTSFTAEVYDRTSLSPTDCSSVPFIVYYEIYCFPPTN